MAKLYFRYGAMGSSKSANALMVKYNYEERHQKVLLLKPSLDRRDGETVIRSRCGLESPCAYFEIVYSDGFDARHYDCIVVDEAQFLKKRDIEMLVRIVDEYGVPVVAYGLRADFKGDLFEGSQWLLAWADTIEEVKTICWCGRKATYNARVVDGKVVKTGEQIVLGANELYVGLCRTHWMSGMLKQGDADVREGVGS